MDGYTETGTEIQVGATAVPIPLTLEVPRQSGDQRYRGRIWLSTGLSVVLFIFSFSIFFMGVSIFLKPILFVLVLLVGSLGIRYLLLEENVYRKNFRRHFLKDYRLSTKDIWGIYHIDPHYPHVVRYRNKRIGMFILFDKNVRVGRDTNEHHHEHYEDVALAYRAAGTHGLSVVHIDQRIDVGIDPRIDNLFEGLSQCSNPDVRDILTEIYTGLTQDVAYFISSQDIFLLTTKGSVEDLQEGFEAFKNHLVGSGSRANYISFQVLNQEGIRRLAQDLFNLEEFSAVDASVNSIEEGAVGLVPIRLIHGDGTETPLRKSSPDQEASKKPAKKTKTAKKSTKKSKTPNTAARRIA